MKSVQLVVDVHATDEYGDAPEFAVIEVTLALLGRLADLSRLCKLHGLESVSVTAGPTTWHREEELRITGDSLRIFGDVFWFEAYPKHAHYRVETSSIDIQALTRLCSDAGKQADPIGEMAFIDGVLYRSSYPDDLAAAYREASEEEAA